MRQNSKKILYRMLLAFGALSILRIFLVLGIKNPLINGFFMLLNYLLLVVLIFHWGLSIRNRILQDKVRHYLFMMTGLMFFWIMVRTIKFQLPIQNQLARFLWYLYYVPVIFIPLFGFMAALYFKKSYLWRPPLILKGLYGIGFLLLILVLSNDSHQKVFLFQDQFLNWSQDYTYQIGFYAVGVWAFILSIGVLFNLLSKNPIPKIKNKLSIPITLLMISILYAIFYNQQPQPFIIRLYDMTLAFNILILSFWESLIQIGLLPVNQNHTIFFEESNLKAQILDKKGTVVIKNKKAVNLNEAWKKGLLESNFIKISGEMYLNSKQIKGGSVVWEENVKEIQQLFQDKKDVRDELLDSLSLLEAELSLKKKRLSLQLKHEMYDTSLQQVEKELRTLKNKLNGKHQIDHDALLEITALGIFLKRKLNLIFLSHSQPLFKIEDVVLSLNEIFSLLHLKNCETEIDYYDFGKLNFETVYTLLDYLEETIMPSIHTLTSCTVDFKKENQDIEMKLALNGILTSVIVTERSPL